MRDWSPEASEHWARVRAKGAVRYVALAGLMWGTLMFLATSVISGAFLLRNGLIYLLGGICYGLAMWSWFEYRFRRSGQRHT